MGKKICILGFCVNVITFQHTTEAQSHGEKSKDKPLDSLF